MVARARPQQAGEIPLRDAVFRRFLPVHQEDRDLRPVARLEIGIGRDVDLLDARVETGPSQRAPNRRLHLLAEVTAGPRVERERDHQPGPPDRAACPPYFAVITKWPRRFCDQQPSFSSVQIGCSLPLLTIVIREDATPRLIRYSFTAEARREPRPRLYSALPRESQCPSIVTIVLPQRFIQSASFCRVARPASRISARSSSK